ncbi:MAG: oxygenase MpaB family protein [Moraxellaceae bacterium]|nr:oxygenase MpaB family protein [Moraxellaceae bacterium]
MSTGLQVLDKVRSARRWKDPQATIGLRMLGIKTTDSRFAQLKQSLWQGDPLADNVAAWIHANRGGWALFQQALTQGIHSQPDAPECVKALFAQVDQRPAWVDDELMQRGANAVLRSGLYGSTALGSCSLMIGYAADAAVKPLAMTANLSQGARKRLSETSRWTIDCATSGILARHSEGFHSTLRVRLMHAFVRQSLRANPEWQFDAWGEPIMQLDMVATQLEFSTVFIAGCAAQGLLFSAAEREAIMHYYRYVCWLMGVDEVLQPTNFREGIELAAMLHATSNMAPDQDSIALTKGLFNALKEMVNDQPGEQWLKRLLIYRSAALTRLMLGDELSNRMQVPPAPMKSSILLMSAMTLIADQSLGLTSMGRKFRARIGRQQFIAGSEAKNFGFIPTMKGKKLVAEASAA